MEKFTAEYLDKLIKCAKRESKMRERVYPNRVSMGKMTAAQKDKEIQMMIDIAEFLDLYKKDKYGEQKELF